jgi:hypothetical protein
MEQYTRDSLALRTAITQQQAECLASVYDVHTGEVRILPQPVSW